MRQARYLRAAVEKVLGGGKMAFVGGPRQVGKTTMALQSLGKDATEEHPGYLTWGDPSTAARLRRADLPPDQQVVLLDETHKYAHVRNLVKGIYDLGTARKRIVGT